MNEKLNNHQPNPKRLETLASDVTYSAGNTLLHQFVIDNSDPNPSGSESYMNAVLMSIAPTNVNALNNEGYSPLHLATLKNNALMVKKLLAYLTNIDVNKKCSFDREENTALHLAAKLGNLCIIQELLNKGADVNNRNERCFTALFFAAELGNVDVMQMLLNKGADVNGKCGSRFHYLREFNNSEARKSCIRDGSGLHLIDCDNETISNFSLTCSYRHSGKLDYIKEETIRCKPKLLLKKDFNRCKGFTPLHFAVKCNNIEAVKCLVNNGADVNIEDFSFDTLLHYAAKSSNASTIALLVSKGAYLNSRAADRCTPLHYAVKFNDVAAVAILVNKGADINSRDKDGCTPLHYAAKSSDASTIALLVSKGADLNSEAADSCTPLHYAVKFNDVTAVATLVYKGADINFRDKDGCTPLHYAEEFDDAEILEFLIKGTDVNATRYCSDENALHHAAQLRK